MDAFEQLVAEVLQGEGYWTKTSFKVELTDDDKRLLESRSLPRWELDVIGYRPKDNLLRIVECKSYLDSKGVNRNGFDPNHKDSKRFKLFNKGELRTVVIERLVDQLVSVGASLPNPRVELCLACGKLVEKDREWIRGHFDKSRWKLFEEDWLREHLLAASRGSYENQVSAVVAKLLLRKNAPKSKNAEKL